MILIYVVVTVVVCISVLLLVNRALVKKNLELEQRKAIAEAKWELNRQMRTKTDEDQPDCRLVAAMKEIK